MLRIACGLLLAMTGRLLHADTLHDVLATLASKPLVRAEFMQDKVIPGLREPLLSTGTLVFSHADGVLLTMRTPAASQLIMSGSAIVQKTGGRTTRQRLDRSPYGAIASVFTHLAGGDPSLLLNTFTVDVIDERPGNWTLRLQPRDRTLQKSISQVTLSGDDYLRELQIEDVRKARTRMQLSQFRTDPALTDEEQALFKLAH